MVDSTKPHLVILNGPTASGKTLYARGLIAQGYVEVEDEIDLEQAADAGRNAVIDSEYFNAFNIEVKHFERS